MTDVSKTLSRRRAARRRRRRSSGRLRGQPRAVHPAWFFAGLWITLAVVTIVLFLVGETT